MSDTYTTRTFRVDADTSLDGTLEICASHGEFGGVYVEITGYGSESVSVVVPLYLVADVAGELIKARDVLMNAGRAALDTVQDRPISEELQEIADRINDIAYTLESMMRDL